MAKVHVIPLSCLLSNACNTTSTRMVTHHEGEHGVIVTQGSSMYVPAVNTS